MSPSALVSICEWGPQGVRGLGVLSLPAGRPVRVREGGSSQRPHPEVLPLYPCCPAAHIVPPRKLRSV